MRSSGLSGWKCWMAVSQSRVTYPLIIYLPRLGLIGCQWLSEPMNGLDPSMWAYSLGTRTCTFGWKEHTPSLGSGICDSIFQSVWKLQRDSSLYSNCYIGICGVESFRRDIHILGTLGFHRISLSACYSLAIRSYVLLYWCFLYLTCLSGLCRCCVWFCMFTKRKIYTPSPLLRPGSRFYTHLVVTHFPRWSSLCRFLGMAIHGGLCCNLGENDWIRYPWLRWVGPRKWDPRGIF